MSVAQQKVFTLAEYLAYNGNLFGDRIFELENGILREMPPESWQNLKIVNYLISLILQKLPYEQFTNKTEIIVSGSRISARVPDLLVLSPEGVVELNRFGRSTITLDMPPPILAVEVVSPGKEARERDYRYKRSEYAARGIANYWIVDPQAKRFICLSLVDGLYEETIYEPALKTISLQPFALDIDLSQIFNVS